MWWTNKNIWNMKSAEADDKDSNIKKWLEISLKKKRQRIWLMYGDIKWVCILIIEYEDLQVSWLCYVIPTI